MIYLIIALVAALCGAGILGWRLFTTVRRLKRSETRCRDMQQDRAIRQNLEYILDGREAELRRLKGQLRRLQDRLSDMEQQASEMNLNLFHESGLRILREKEEGARRMKMDLMERQLDDANRLLRAERAQSKAEIERLNGIIAGQTEKIEKLSAPTPRRASRRMPEGLPNQVTLNDLLSGDN